jgi:hypothetical protein
MEFQFTLRFDVGDEFAGSDVLVERLWAAGCDDAIVGLGCAGRVALSFGREAPTRDKAIDSALRDVASALPSARLLEIQ